MTGRSGGVDQQQHPWSASRAVFATFASAHSVTIAGGRGAVNAVAAQLLSVANDSMVVSAWLGFQNGDVVRVSLQVNVARTPTVVLVGSSDLIVHRHTMDVRGLALSDELICSASDDGTLLRSSVAATSSAASNSRTPVAVAPQCELLACRFVSATRVVVAARNRRTYVVDVVSGTVVADLPVPHVVRAVSGPTGLCVTQSGRCIVAATVPGATVPPTALLEAVSSGAQSDICETPHWVVVAAARENGLLVISKP